MHNVINDNCLKALGEINHWIDCTFLDPPFNQNKKYSCHNDNMDIEEYWSMMKDVCNRIYNKTKDGGSIYFMQRDKNTEEVLRVLRETEWVFRSQIIWKKMTSAVPIKDGFGKQYQIIIHCTKGKPRVFNKLRIDPPLLKNQKYERENGVYVTDVWDDIRELTSGFFAGKEPLKTPEGQRFHKQQSPIALLLRIILSSTNVNDWILDPFAGTGTTLCVASQLKRNSIGIEIDKNNCNAINERLNNPQTTDSIEKYFDNYSCTDNLKVIWGK
jgi:DNA modification methylase